MGKSTTGTLTPKERVSGATGVGLGVVVMWAVGVVVHIFASDAGFFAITGMFAVLVCMTVLSSIKQAIRDGVIR